MYRVTIVTKYNTINMIVDDPNSPELKEILAQPYIIETKMERIDDNVRDTQKLERKKKD